jgi:tetratricopeptide (TPR) repeat protein
VFRVFFIFLLGTLMTAGACTPAPRTYPHTATGAAEVQRDFMTIYEAGRALMLQKKYPDAIVPLTRALALAPRSQRALVLADRGYCYLQNRQTPLALDDCQQAVTLEPKFHYGYYLRASVQAQLNVFDKAIADLEHCLVLKPNDAMTLKLSGYIYYLINDFSTALSVFDDLAHTGQDAAYIQNFRAKILRSLGRDNDAAAALEILLSHDPTYAEAYSQMGLICEDQGALPEAIGAYTLFLKYVDAHDPENAEWIHNVKQRIRKLRFKVNLGLK